MSDEWVPLRTCAWLHEAHLLRSVLEADGIEAYIPDEQTLGIRPELGAALGGVRLLVRASDLERARDVLEAMAGDPADAAGRDD